jgi:hypothetical protein
MMYLKLLENQEQPKPWLNRLKEIVKLRTEINEMETKITIQHINKTKAWLWNKDWQTLRYTNQNKEDKDSNS